jgi:predicted metal-binding protein
MIMCSYKTQKGKHYPLEFNYNVIDRESVPVDYECTRKACEEGCNLYMKNGGCPPFAPKFVELPGSELLVMYARLCTKNYPIKVLKGPYYTKWVFVETFMTPVTNRIGKSLSEKLNGYFISSGNCQVCKPKKCAVKLGNKCQNPRERTYSLEATGILVTSLMENHFNIKLEWWDKNNPNIIPEYMYKVVGILNNGISNLINIKKVIAETINEDKAIVI